jgi:hypothetical protein
VAVRIAWGWSLGTGKDRNRLNGTRLAEIRVHQREFGVCDKPAEAWEPSSFLFQSDE